MPSKRSHGEGTLRHRSDGRWELRMMDGYQKDGSPRFKTFYGKTQKEVKLKLKEYQDALISGVQLDTILYFEDWADTWFEGHKDNIAPTTQESYKYCLKMLKEGFYHRPLTVIRPIDIENFLKGMRRDGRSDSYISKARGMLYQIFQKAEANDLVRRNPVRLAEKMRASGTAKRKEAFTTAEVAHLMKVLPDDRMGLSIRLLLGTGMRMQELLALEPQFIEEDGSVIHIRQAVKVVKGTVSIGSPKSKDSIRDIPVPLNVRPCAIKLRDTTDQFIWESPKTGLPCNPTHFRDVFRKSLEEAGDVRLLTPHSCRHTYVSQMQALGVDIQTIQSIVGHADTESGGHVGEMTTMALVPQVVDAVDVPVIAAGGIADGRQLAAAFALGACGVQVGTCLLVSEECPVHENYKAALLRAKDSDTIVTGRIGGTPVRVLKNRMSREYVRQEKAGADKMELEKYTLGSLRRAVFEGDTATGSLMAGQVAGMLHEVRPVAEILDELWESGRQRMHSLSELC